MTQISNISLRAEAVIIFHFFLYLPGDKKVWQDQSYPEGNIAARTRFLCTPGVMQSILTMRPVAAISSNAKPGAFLQNDRWGFYRSYDLSDIF